MRDQLPAVHDLEPAEAARLALLHINSASSMMRTVRLVAPHIFASATSTIPNLILVHQLQGGSLLLVLALIELQLFNLKRAAVLVARAQELVLQGPHVSTSTCASSLE
jgi:hypothetical protein